MASRARDQRRVLNAQPQPRVLILGHVPQAVEETVRQLAPTVDERTQQIYSVKDTIRWADWDAVVAGSHAEGASPTVRTVHTTPDKIFVSPVHLEIPPRLPVLKVASHDPGQLDAGVAVRSKPRPCVTLLPVTNEDADTDRLARLAEGLAPIVRERKIAWKVAANDRWNPISLLNDEDGDSLVLLYQRAENSLLSAVVPEDMPQLDQWVRGMFRIWAKSDPSSFGSIHDWSQQSRWHTAEETFAYTAAEAHRLEREKLIADHEAEQSKLDQKVAGANAKAVDGSRRLLTESGKALVAAVAEALATLGFSVVDKDEQLASKGKDEKTFDLEITDVAEPDWIAIAEVKGYSKGAKASDLNALLGKNSESFVLERGRVPSRRWYIVNQFRNDMPEGRPLPLETNPDAVASFVKNDGAVIDTRCLFLLAESSDWEKPDELSKMRQRLRARLGVWPIDDSASQTESTIDNQATP